MIGRTFFLSAAAVAASCACSSPALAWGQTGHRVIGTIAESHLSGFTRAQVRQILGIETLDEASTWPDFMRSAPGEFWQETSVPWHYVTVPGVQYSGSPSEGDALQALRFFTRQVRDPRTSLEHRQLALRFIIHLVGDLHQPLHVGRPGDRGGGTVKVKWFGRDTNLHVVWDSTLIEQTQLSFTELATRLQRHTSSGDVIAWWNAEPRVWISESAQVRETIYPANTDLAYEYVYQHTPTVEMRLKQGGVRLAAYLNDLFEGMPPPRASKP